MWRRYRARYYGGAGRRLPAAGEWVCAGALRTGFSPQSHRLGQGISQELMLLELHHPSLDKIYLRRVLPGGPSLWVWPKSAPLPLNF